MLVPGAGAGAGAGLEGRLGLLQPRAEDLQRLVRAQPLEQLFDVEAEPFASGRFACVRRCRARASGRVCAAKFAQRVRLGEDCRAELLHEVALLALCAPSPRVVALLAVFETPKHLVMLLEYAPGGDLQSVLDDDAVPFEADAARFVRQLLEALAFLHERRVAHLDIKPQNLVLTAEFPRGDVKLCDFEVSRVISAHEPLREILGTPDYVAPEILHYEPITLAADMWSAGVTAYVLLTGFSPFGGETDQETFCNVARAQLDFPEELFDGVSAHATAFVRALLERDPSARPTAAEGLRHPWLQGHAGKGVAAAGAAAGAGAEGAGAGAGGKRELRRFLSKSREALAERWLAGRSGGLRRGAPLSQSQVSLSRSREKLYGLRALSRSQELFAWAGAGAGTGAGAGAGPAAPSPLLAAALARATAAAATSTTASQPDLPRAGPSPFALSPAPSPFGSAASLDAAASSPSPSTAPARAAAPAHAHADTHAQAHPRTAQPRERATSEPGSAPAPPPAQRKQQEEEEEEKNKKKNEEVKRTKGEEEEEKKDEEEEEEEEPRFSVAQLISAFNRHQQMSAARPAALRSLILQMHEEAQRNGAPPAPP